MKTSDQTIKYRGMAAQIFPDGEGGFYGKLANIKDLVTFEGDTLDASIDAFREAVDDYLGEDYDYHDYIG